MNKKSKNNKFVQMRNGEVEADGRVLRKIPVQKIKLKFVLFILFLPIILYYYNSLPDKGLNFSGIFFILAYLFGFYAFWKSFTKMSVKVTSKDIGLHIQRPFLKKKLIKISYSSIKKVSVTKSAILKLITSEKSYKIPREVERPDHILKKIKQHNSNALKGQDINQLRDDLLYKDHYDKFRMQYHHTILSSYFFVMMSIFATFVTFFYYNNSFVELTFSNATTLGVLFGLFLTTFLIGVSLSEGFFLRRFYLKRVKLERKKNKTSYVTQFSYFRSIIWSTSMIYAFIGSFGFYLTTSNFHVKERIAEVNDQRIHFHFERYPKYLPQKGDLIEQRSHDKDFGLIIALFDQVYTDEQGKELIVPENHVYVKDLNEKHKLVKLGNDINIVKIKNRSPASIDINEGIFFSYLRQQIQIRQENSTNE